MMKTAYENQCYGQSGFHTSNSKDDQGNKSFWTSKTFETDNNIRIIQQ